MLRIFVSYPGIDGTDYATKAKNILNEAGYRTWVFFYHRTPGALPWDEISGVILNKTTLASQVKKFPLKNSQCGM